MEEEIDHPLFTKNIPGNFDTNAAFLALAHLSSSEGEEVVKSGPIRRRQAKKKTKKTPYDKKVKEAEFVMKNLGL